MGNLAWRFDERERAYIAEVLDSGFASGTSGSMNTRLENAFAQRHGVNYAVTFNSGTTTLHAALRALGVGFGDEVIVTPLTVISCMNAILYCNAIPVFADVDPETFLMDPDDVQRKLTTRTKAIMAVHLYGQVCDMSRILAIAENAGIGVVEDCAQCYLGTHDGHLAGTIGDIGSWSFENSKHLTTGDGGIVTCNDERLATKLRKLGSQGFCMATAKSGQIRINKDHFQNPDFQRHDILGYMYRLPEVCAAMGLAQLEKLDEFVAKRERAAAAYADVVADVDWLQPQRTPAGDRNAYYTYALRYLHTDVPWETFRKTYMENGGDGIYAAWKLCYQEGSIGDIRSWLRPMGLSDRFVTDVGICPVAETIQPELMQFTTNQKDDGEIAVQTDALVKTIDAFR